MFEFLKNFASESNSGAEQGDSSDNRGGGGQGPRPSSLIAIAKLAVLPLFFSFSFLKPSFYCSEKYTVE
jgi:hypothetical protein